jgi:hypothetical protein
MPVLIRFRNSLLARCSAIAVFAAASAGCYAPQTSQADSAAKPAATPAPQAPAAKESTRAPVQPVPAESRTPEEAAKRAADPKDPSGALIVEPPKAKP